MVGVRGEIANADVALLLMVFVLAGAVIGGRTAGVLSAAAAAMAFDFFHTRPYGTLKIANRDDVMTTAMWSSWVEINPKTAAQLRIAPGDLVEVSSQHGSVRAPAILSQGIAPDLIAMPVGQGHEKFGRFASGRGANPLSILAPLAERETGALAWAATRVKLARIGGPKEGKLITFAGGLSQFPIEQERR